MVDNPRWLREQLKLYTSETTPATTTPESNDTSWQEHYHMSLLGKRSVDDFYSSNLDELSQNEQIGEIYDQDMNYADYFRMNTSENILENHKDMNSTAINDENYSLTNFNQSEMSHNNGEISENFLDRFIKNCRENLQEDLNSEIAINLIVFGILCWALVLIIYFMRK